MLAFCAVHEISGLARIFHKLAGFFTSGTVLEEKSGWTALVFRFRRNLILIVL
jgi:hypothetical protein